MTDVGPGARIRGRACALGLLLCATPAPADDRWWFGGGIGVGLGDVTFVSIEPIVGYAVTPRLGVGARAILRYRDDERYSPSLSTSDYGASLFTRYDVAQPIFVQAEYERLSYEYLLFDGSTSRDDFDSLLVGGGVSQPLGGNSSFFAAALYNLSYDDSDARSPYDDPYVVRFGVGFHF